MRLYYFVNTNDPDFQPEGLTLPGENSTLYKFSQLNDNGNIFYQVDEFKSTEVDTADIPSEIENNTKLASKICRNSIKTIKVINKTMYKKLEVLGNILKHVEDIYTSGDAAISSYKKEDHVECVLYSLETTGNVAKLTLTISKLSKVQDQLSKYLGKDKTQIKSFLKKAGVVIDIAMAAIKLGFDIYDYYQADNSVEKRICVEKMASHIADFGIGLAAKSVWQIKVITMSWELTMSFLSKLFPNPLVEKALKKPGQALVFLYEYIYFPVIPGAICEIAYEHGLSEMESYRDEWCKNGHPVAILISD